MRRDLETALEERLRARWAEAGVDATPAPADVPTALEDLVAADDGPSLADHVRRRADRDQVLELLRQRSVYHLKESDPSAFVVPRLPVRAKAALMALQFDEYGDGDPNRLHSHLFARGLEAVGLRAEYGAYVDDAVPENLEMNNAGSLFGLHRRLRGAAMGHLAAFEMTSSLPSRKMVQGLDRLGLDGPMSDYYDEHVEADAIHEHLAARDICGTLAEDEPDQAAEILFGAFTCLDVEARFATAMLGAWEDAAVSERDFDHPDVVLVPHGPMLLRGAESVQDLDGTVHAVDRPVVALCRCEKSSRLPWCDGTHKVIPRS